MSLKAIPYNQSHNLQCDLCNLPAYNHDDQILLQTVCSKKFNEIHNYHKKCLRKIAFYDYKSKSYFPCPNCSEHISKLHLFKKIDIIGQKILAFFSKHLFLFRISSFSLGSIIIIHSSMIIKASTGYIGLGIFVAAQALSIIYGLFEGSEAALEVGSSDKTINDREIIVISNTLFHITKTAVISNIILGTTKTLISFKPYIRNLMGLKG